MSASIEAQGSVTAYQAMIARAASLYLTGIYSLVDIYGSETGFAFFSSSLAVWGLGYALLVALIKVSDTEGYGQKGSIMAYFGLSIVTTFAVMAGFVLLVLPGLYLFMRWLPAFARLQETGEGVFAAMGWSWEHTQPVQKALSLALIWPIGIAAASILIIVWQEYNYLDASDFAYTTSIVAMNLTLSVYVAWLQLLGVATYRAIRHNHLYATQTFS